MSRTPSIWRTIGAALLLVVTFPFLVVAEVCKRSK